MSPRRPVVLAAIAAALVLPGSAAAQGLYAPPCRFVSQAEQHEQALRDVVRARKDFTFPASLALVERLDRDPAARRRGGGFFPMRPAEAAYLRDRVRAERDAGRIGRRLRDSEPLSGGISIEDDYPRGAFVRVRITRALTPAERRDLRAGVRFVRFQRVARSYRQLRRQQDRIDFDALRSEGIDISSTSPDIDRNAVDVEFSSPRPDAEDVIQERYGPGLLLVRIPSTFDSCASPDGYTVGADGRTLALSFGSSGSLVSSRVEVTESATQVSVAVVETLPPFQTADLRLYEAQVTLAAPLGDRRVVSTLTRKAVPPIA